jgi:hypothetical protein
MALYSVRIERQVCKQIGLALLFRSFLGLQPRDEVFDYSTITENRQRFETHGLTNAFFDAIVAETIAKNQCRVHVRVDGTITACFAIAKSFRPKANDNDNDWDTSLPPQDGNGFKPSNPDVDFRGQKRTNETHRSRTDPESKRYRKGKGKEAKLSHFGHELTENRNGLIVTVAATEAKGKTEPEATITMSDDLKAIYGRVPKTPGGDKGSGDGAFFTAREKRKIVPHFPLVKTPVDSNTVTQKKRLRGFMCDVRCRCGCGRRRMSCVCDVGRKRFRPRRSFGEVARVGSGSGMRAKGVIGIRENLW